MRSGLAGGLAALTLACGGDAGRQQGASAPTGVSIGSSAEQTDGPDGSASSVGTADGGSAECLSDSDCADGEHCGVMSQVCLGPTDCVFDGDCDDGFTCEDGTCSIGGECGGFQFSLSQVPPNLLILLDRSGSMSGDVAGTGQNRWEVARAAIIQVTTTFADEIRFGLATYSSCIAPGCSAGEIVTPIADGNAVAIQGFLNNTVGAGSLDGQGMTLDGKVRYLCDSGFPETSTGTSLNALVGEPSLLDPARTNAVLLLTDGGESQECIQGANGAGGASNLFGQTPSVWTYAVGMGGASVGQLQQIAVAGGTVTPYFADQPADLQAALDQIAASVSSCTFTLDQVPPDEAQIFVFFDLDPAGVPQGLPDGWTYDAGTNSITFHGQSCADLREGAIVDVDIVYGCNKPPVG